VSTTQVVSGAVMGAGATHRFSAVRWGVARRIVWAWIFTIPASATLAALAALTIKTGPFTVVLTLLVLVTSFALLAWWTRGDQPGPDVGA
jgi:hypothetical protein